MPQLELIGSGLPENVDPKQKYAYGKISNNQGQERYLIVDKLTKEPVCQNHWNNDLDTLKIYIQSLNSPNQRKCVGCGMLEKCN